MAENSKIEWTDHTFNPWIGCQKVSPGCHHCYAETLMDHRYGKVKWGPQGTRQRTSEANWRKPLQWNRQAAKEGRRYRVFCASLADVFEDRPELVEWRRDLMILMERTPNLDWLLLTKRPENIMRMIAQGSGVGNAATWFQGMGSRVWIGTSVENQDAADKRIPELLKIPARVRFLSCEPLLGPVDLTRWLCHWSGVHEQWLPLAPELQEINWVIVGGESGYNARPMHPGWARSIRDQCIAADIAFHFKQWGEYAPICEDTPMPASYARTRMIGLRADGTTISGDDFIEGATAWMWRAGKHAAGRLLDGREWNEFPAANLEASN